MNAAPGYDVIVKLQQTDAQVLSMTAHFQGEKFAPEQIKTHAALKALNDAWPDLVNKVNGRITDADRFRAMKEFTLLEATDKPRFVVINEMIQKYEEENGMANSNQKTEAQVLGVADFLVHALMETKPKFVAPTTKAD